MNHNGSSPRITLLSGESETQGHHYRMVHLAEALQESFAIASTGVTFANSDLSSEQITLLEQADIIWLWRMGLTEQLAAMLHDFKARGGRLIVDMDDLIFDPKLMHPRYLDTLRFESEANLATTKERFIQRRHILDEADRLVFTTRSLAEYAHTLCGKPYSVLPNGFDVERLTLTRSACAAWKEQCSDDYIRVGYAAGTRTHQADFAVVAPALATILGTHSAVRLVLYKSSLLLEEFPGLSTYESQIEWRDNVPLSLLPQEIARFDINIAPLETDNIFCRCKSELKFFEAALAEVPTIASPTPPFADAIIHPKTGLLADSQQEWEDALNLLIRDVQTRKQLGEQAFLAVQKPFGPAERKRLAQAIVKEVYTNKTTILHE